MQTTHKVIFSNSQKMDALPSESVNLVITSPPYPMIKMWDELFSEQCPAAKDALKKGSGMKAFETMHRQLDPVWSEVYRVLQPGGFACINIGDATRTINGDFALYPNHARILSRLLELGFNILPDVLWRKPTNAPNKFMGSGMLPAGAYVTLEHEYILIARKGQKRLFKTEIEKQNRRESAIFWEERNVFYSDIWFEIRGTPQAFSNKDARSRSAAYPFELAYRLINMYSMKGDTVLDPFWGTGTTTAAAVTSGRHSIGFEMDLAFRNMISAIKNESVPLANKVIHNRLSKHIQFVVDRLKENKTIKYKNNYYGFPVVTAQERELLLNEPVNIEEFDRDSFKVNYHETAQKAFCKDWQKELKQKSKDLISEDIVRFKQDGNQTQMKLF